MWGEICINLGSGSTLKAQLPCVAATALNPKVSLEGNQQFDTSNCRMGGSLDTSYRTICNKIQEIAKNVRFIPVDAIDRSVKSTNIEALNYYIFKKVGHIKNINYENACLLDYAEKTFFGYIKAINKTDTFVSWTDTDTGTLGLKKIENRFSLSYREKIIKRMNWLMWKYGNENACLLTLTMDPKKYNNDKFEMWKQIGIKFTIFIRKMKIWFKRHGREFPSYLFGVEAMFGRSENNYISRGNPHLHVVFFGCKYFAPAAVIEKYWGQGFVKINSTANNEKVRYPIHYVTKYITKTFTVNDPKNVLCQSLVWLFNKHSFDRSAGLVLPLNPKSSGNCYSTGLWNIPAGYYQIDEMIIIQDVIQSLFGGFKDPPPIPINHDLHEGVIN